MNEKSTQISHAIFKAEDLDAAVLTYRERVRETDPPELKQMIRKHALESHCPLKHENLDRAISVLEQLVLADTEQLFEPEPETDENEGETEDADAEPDLKAQLQALDADPESLQSAILEVLESGSADDSGAEPGWTLQGLAHRIEHDNETTHRALQTLIDAGKVVREVSELIDEDLYFRAPDEAGAKDYVHVRTAIIDVLSQESGLSFYEIEEKVPLGYHKNVLLKTLRDMTNTGEARADHDDTGTIVYHLVEPTGTATDDAKKQP